MNVRSFGRDLDSIPTASPQQHADARKYVERVAPDCIAAIFGEGDR